MERALFGMEDNEGFQEIGALEKANGGVVYLDEVSELPMDLQSKLLKTLIENSIKRIGSNKKFINVRFVSLPILY